MQKSIVALGLMSGTSLDGLDIAICRFWQTQNHWQFETLATDSIAYTGVLQAYLQRAHLLHGVELAQLDQDLGIFFGDKAAAFIQENQLNIDLIASHGHTILHQPNGAPAIAHDLPYPFAAKAGFTTQIGNPNAIAAATNLPVVADFRSADIAQGGQGAPLVPIGDELLFGQYDGCLNLGGFANVSYKKEGVRVAFDISPANMPLNILAQELGHQYDAGGAIARAGKPDHTLLDQLNALPFYREKTPKSLGKEWFDANFAPLLQKNTSPPADQMHTTVLHLAEQIGSALPSKGQILVTGGGAFNTFLIEEIQKNTDAKIILPDADLINFKEAIVFAFLGTLRWLNLPNTLSSATGARKNVCGGAIVLP